MFLPFSSFFFEEELGWDAMTLVPKPAALAATPTGWDTGGSASSRPMLPWPAGPRPAARRPRGARKPLAVATGQPQADSQNPRAGLGTETSNDSAPQFEKRTRVTQPVAAKHGAQGIMGRRVVTAARWGAAEGRGKWCGLGSRGPSYAVTGPSYAVKSRGRSAAGPWDAYAAVLTGSCPPSEACRFPAS